MIWARRIGKESQTNLDGEESATISINASPQTSTQVNKIYFYDYINSESVLELNKQIDEAAKQMQIVQVSLGLDEPPPVKLHINSKGGEVASALCVSDKIRRSPVPIYTYGEGEIASGATLISISGHRRFMAKHSFFLIHQISSEFWGKFAEFEDEMKNLKMMTDVIKELFTSYTAIPLEELEKLMEHDLYIGPEACLQWKMVDAII